MPTNLLPPAEPHRTVPPPMRGGGCLIAAGVVIGPVVGLIVGEASIGLVAGLGIGTLAAIVLTVLDRRR